MNTQDIPLTSVHTTNFPNILTQLGISLVVSTYQAGKLIVLRADNNSINTHFRTFDRPMGLAVDREKLALGTAYQIIELRNVPAVAPKLEPLGKHDACYLPRRTHITGDIDIHEMAYTNDELWFINTRFSCLCTLDKTHSFVPRWRPNFINAYDLSDRCHLNGLSIRNNQPQYITALGETNEAAGWRKNKTNGGILIDIPSNEIICRGLSMPHSPRWYREELWVLESGNGSLAKVDLTSGKLTAVAQVPGFTRGLAFWENLAFIGLSQIRETAVFSGLPITKSLTERNCGVWVVNINTGEIIAFLRFEDGVQEIFAIGIIPGFLFPEVINWDEQLLGTTYILPDAALQEVELTEKILQPEDTEYLLNLGNDAYNQGNLEAAMQQYQKCLELKPDYLMARYNLGVVYLEQEQWEEAIIELEQVIARDPNHAEAYNNLGIISQHEHRLNQAIEYYQKAIAIRYQFPDAHFNLGMALLQMGEYTQGFAESEWRWQTNNFTPFICPQPLWDGSDLSGKTILIHTEQGSGDAIQFIRYIPLVAERNCRIILVCIPDLMPLFATIPHIDKMIPPGDIATSEFDVYAPLMSLPHILGTTLDTIPAQIPYLEAREQNVVFPILHSSQYNKLKLGIVWCGSHTHKNDRNRSCQLDDFAPILNMRNIDFFSLQKVTKPTDVAKLQEFNVCDLSYYLRDYGDTARAIAQLDLVITVDTSVAHLAGALGKPVWTLLCYSPDWRWMLERNDTPWYPTMRLFRQSQPRDWVEVFNRVAEAFLQNGIISEI
ncbi:TIGR03032 family protein [Kamptonema sp. UHCC 0994]|uniref:TIGR03032 family protein n=1 Tax=Kamptonema sp. UHCC 0994 TaxID=3031329 RepID=UPI0023B92995|nr:TIGR03032 family protein [Kamptonema sp. UHCC 0994]MDF0555340.1 TIGR03032 family protein [Kamptonema sp. UHCC 0994]